MGYNRFKHWEASILTVEKSTHHPAKSLSPSKFCSVRFQFQGVKTFIPVWSALPTDLIKLLVESETTVQILKPLDMKLENEEEHNRPKTVVDDNQLKALIETVP